MITPGGSGAAAVRELSGCRHVDRYVRRLGTIGAFLASFAVTLALALGVAAITKRKTRPERVAAVRIRSTHRGWGYSESKLTVTRVGAEYRDGDRRIAATAVEALAGAIQAPVVTGVDFKNLGMTKSWIRDTAEEANRGKVKLPLSFLQDSAQVRRAAAQALSDTFVFDNYPRVEVEVTFEDGRKVLASSSSVAPFMLPWTVMRKDGEIRTENADIGRAVAAIAPPGFVNRELAAGASLRFQVIWFLVHDWQTMGR